MAPQATLQAAGSLVLAAPRASQAPPPPQAPLQALPPAADDPPTTVRFIRQRILPYIDDRLAVMEKEGVSLGGVSPFNPDAFKTHLGKDKTSAW